MVAAALTKLAIYAIYAIAEAERSGGYSFHAAGAPVAPALRPLAAVARESSSRVDQVSCRERVFQSREQSDPHGSQFGS